MNRQWRVARYPRTDEPIGPAHFDWVEQPVPEPADGEFLVRTLCLAPGPAQRGYLSPGHADFYGTVPVGEVMRGRGVAEVVTSRHPDYAAGDIFVGSLGWQDYSVQRPRGAEFVFSNRKIAAPSRPLPTTTLGMLGQAGTTAWFGLHEAGGLRVGDNVLVSAAAGGVGSMAGQIARLKGAGRTVGIAGTAAKCEWLCKVLGFDAAINYRSDDLAARLRELFPGGIDLFFDNVGGEILNQALANLARGARVAVCGYIASDYAGHKSGPANYHHLVYQRARMQGFVVFDYWQRFAEAETALMAWYRAGRLSDCEDMDEGLERMPESLGSLFSGGNRGIRLCRVAADPAHLPLLARNLASP
ncbi:MAG: NADP-dependent oxidoreductase [Gammaproteobacteria bacterium]|nr:NADP-dependent oxidoreductase [Gammaproteobacteria bacterium]